EKLGPLLEASRLVLGPPHHVGRIVRVVLIHPSLLRVVGGFAEHRAQRGRAALGDVTVPTRSPGMVANLAGPARLAPAPRRLTPRADGRYSPERDRAGTRVDRDHPVHRRRRLDRPHATPGRRAGPA